MDNSIVVPPPNGCLYKPSGQHVKRWAETSEMTDSPEGSEIKICYSYQPWITLSSGISYEISATRAEKISTRLNQGLITESDIAEFSVDGLILTEEYDKLVTLARDREGRMT